jgi:hypothetical protein
MHLFQNEKILFQSFFRLMTVQPFFLASATSLELVRSFTHRMSLETLVQLQQGALIQRDQAPPRVVDVVDQRNDHRN